MARINLVLKFGIFLLLAFLSSYSKAQVKIISKYHQIVPQGKKWVLTTTMKSIVELNEGTLTSGTFCNARILSNPRSLSGIAEGEYQGREKSYNITFTDFYKVPYTNDFTYQISSIIGFDYINPMNLESTRTTTLTFYQGQTVFTYGCLQSIQVLEKTLTQQELITLKKEEILKRQKEVENEKEGKIQERKYEDDRILYKLDHGSAFDEFELDSVNRPVLNCENTDFLKSFFSNCLFKKEECPDTRMTCNAEYEITYDTTLQPIAITKKTYYEDNNGNISNEATITTFDCSVPNILDNFKKCFQLNKCAEVYFKNRKYKVSVTIYLHVKEHLNYLNDYKIDFYSAGSTERLIYSFDMVK